MASRKVLWKLGSLGSPWGLTIAPDGTTAFVTLTTDPVGVIDLMERTLVRKIVVRRRMVLGLAHRRREGLAGPTA